MENTDDQKKSMLSPRRRPEAPKTSKNSAAKRMQDFIPMLNAAELEVDDVEVAIGAEPHEAGKSKSQSFLSQASGLNEISEINNTTQGDTSMNLTGTELLTKL